MRDFTVSVRKVTGQELLHSACEMTFLGTSKQSLLSMYKSEHSPVRTQVFWVELRNIPLFVSTHLLRHHVGSQPFQLSCRDDRHGGNVGFQEKIDKILDWLNPSCQEEAAYEKAIDTLEWLKANSDRQTPVNLGLFLNAQSLIDMAKLRLCRQAHKDTIEVFKALKKAVALADPDLAKLMVPKCVYRGGICGEPKCCGYNSTEAFERELESYVSNFSPKQCGLFHEDETK